MAEIKVYGADWCGDCRRSKRALESLGVGYDYIDAEAQPEAIEVIREYNGGEQRIPVIIFPDGTHLTEPSDEELTAKLRTAGLV